MMNDDCFNEWKIIPLRLLNKYFRPSFKFHSNFHFESKLKGFPSFHRHPFTNELENLFNCTPPKTLSCVLSQFLWYNNYIKTDNKAI